MNRTLRKILGSILLSIPFVLFFGVFFYCMGFQGIIFISGITITALILAGCITTEINLITK